MGEKGRGKKNPNSQGGGGSGEGLGGGRPSALLKKKKTRLVRKRPSRSRAQEGGGPGEKRKERILERRIASEKKGKRGTRFYRPCAARGERVGGEPTNGEGEKVIESQASSVF